MADRSSIEWTDASWNIVTGCSVVSPGCTNCYAMRLAGSRLRHVAAYRGLTRDTKTGPVWTGGVRFNHHLLDQPIRWRRPRRIFVNAMGDLFHEGVPRVWLDKIHAAMALAPWHDFQVLTKRSEIMREYLIELGDGGMDRVASAMGELAPDDCSTPLRFPFPNVWYGVSAEDQARFDLRVRDLVDLPAAVRWVSAEPLLGPIDATWALHGRLIDWLVAGGESGADARPMSPAWVRTLRDQCARSGVAFNFKQWGEHHPHGQELANEAVNALGNPDDARWHGFADGESTWCVGKARAGRRLDGQIHDDFPNTEELRDVA